MVRRRSLPPPDSSWASSFSLGAGWRSQEAREKSWTAFRQDPDWLAAKEASEKDGKLVEKVEEIYLNPTDFSPLK